MTRILIILIVRGVQRGKANIHLFCNRELSAPGISLAPLSMKIQKSLLSQIEFNNSNRGFHSGISHICRHER